MRSRSAGCGRGRIIAARILLLLPFVALAARAAHLSIVDERGSLLGSMQTQRVLRLAPERGVIFDRNGGELALSVDAPSIYANPSVVTDVEDTARRLAHALGSNPRAVARRLRGNGAFTFVARWASDEQARRVKEAGLPGVGVIFEPRRVYPHRGLAARSIGFANIDGVGVRGLEQQEDDWLRGTARQISVERDARGRLLATRGDDHWSTAGGDLALTIDATLQADAEAALAESVKRSGARGGVVISLDPRTGEILALAEAPSFDPNEFRTLDYPATRSRAFLDAADPGSTLKAFLMAIALEEHAVTPEAMFDCEEGTFRVPGSVIHDSHPHGLLSASQVLQVSSNIGATKIAFAVGPRAHFDGLRRFGFGSVTGAGFPGESAGLLRPWRDWKPLDHATIAFGQGISVTPIQLAAATATLANGGEWVQPRLVKARRAARGAWQPVAATPSRRVVRPETAATVLSMMEGVVGLDGTARRAALREVRVAGKTGTAQKLDAHTGRYADDRFHAWFIGVVPADAPKLVIVAGLDEPRPPHHTGGAAAAPLFARVAAAQLARFGIVTEPAIPAPPPTVAEPPATLQASRPAGAAPAPAAVASARAPAVPRREAAAASVAVAPPPVAAPPPALVSVGERLLLPDFHGLTEAEVRGITADTPLHVKMTGHGRAVAQEPPAGTIVASSQALVFIHFEPPAAGGRDGEI